MAAGRDAFSVLMQPKRRKRQHEAAPPAPSPTEELQSSTGTVVCPGCGKAVAAAFISSHLDRDCSSRSSASGTGRSSSEQESGNAKGQAVVTGTPDKQQQQEEQGEGKYTQRADTVCASEEATPQQVPNPLSAPASGANAFGLMMAASAEHHFKEELCLIFDQDGLQWGWSAPGVPSSHPHGATPAWSSTITVGGRRGGGRCTLWTNMAPQQQQEEGRQQRQAPQGSAGAAAGAVLVDAARPDRLSWLSVAHLKSMLQKNMRRGRAEAAVRCAAELALKSWPDLVRRLSIIALEDSCLHPALPLLAWLMAAAGKGYRPPAPAVAACMAIVHEIAACPVKDSIASAMKQRREADAPSPKQVLATLANGPEGVLCRSLLMRMGYGGMPFDVSLMKAAALLWMHRFTDTTPDHTSHPDPAQVQVPQTSDTAASSHADTNITNTATAASSSAELQAVEARLRSLQAQQQRQQGQQGERQRSGSSGCAEPFGYMTPALRAPPPGTWLHCASALHARCGIPPALLHDVMAYFNFGTSTSTSTSSLPPLLRECDVHPAGIDFHVSNILDDVLARPGAAAEVAAAMDGTAAAADVPGAMRTAMWRYSSGVNARAPLLPLPGVGDDGGGDSSDEGGDGDAALRRGWEVVRPQVEAAAQQFVRARLLPS